MRFSNLRGEFDGQLASAPHRSYRMSLCVKTVTFFPHISYLPDELEKAAK
jgi:hypothetical protein